jgi:hypothetical protein
MKKLCLLVAFLVTTLLTAQTYSVDNKPNAKADFDNLQTAINTVPAGSTLLVQGSTTTYGTLNIEKKITIKGTGYFLNQNPFTQTNKLSSNTSTITLKKGSSGSLITGISSTGFSIHDAEPNLTFIKNNVKYIGQGYLEPLPTNINIYHNYIWGEFDYYSHTQNDNYTVNVGDGSNVIGNYIYKYTKGKNLVLANNHLDVLPSVTYSIIKNNILPATQVPDNSSNFNTYKNNIFSHSNNTSNVADDNGNVLVASPGYIENTDDRYSTDGKYILASGSPAKGAGVDGVDCGMFFEENGVDAGYRLSGLPDIPNIYEFNVPTIGYSNSNGIQINVKVKSNN